MSLQMPEGVPTESFLKTLQKPNMYLDILYLHHKLSTPNVRCQDIFDALGSLYTRLQEHIEQETQPQTDEDVETEPPAMKNNFLFETHNSDIKLQTIMALFLAHAVQRRSQADMLQTIDVAVSQ
jgi:hypothetical protein